MKSEEQGRVIAILKKECRRFPVPYVSEEICRRDPFRVLVACIISLRTKDAVTKAASDRLFAVAFEPGTLARLSARHIERLIKPAGFYRRKARQIRQVATQILDRHSGSVPDSLEGLLALPGVGRKTANLVLTEGFGKPGICVDVHVHRITNRWGLVKTRTPDETEMALRKTLNRRHWRTFNRLLVAYGQNLCRPVSPYCSRCKLTAYCAQIGVRRHR